MIYRFDRCVVDLRQYKLTVDEHPVSIEPQVFDLLVYLIENRDRVVGRDELLRNLWVGKVVTDAALSARLKAARKAVGDSGRSQTLIKTVHGRGYRFVAAVHTTETDNGVLTDEVKSDPKSTEKSMPRAAVAKPSVLVLPFENKSVEPNDEYFAGAITEEIRLNLCRFSELFVFAHGTSIEQDPATPLQAARDLGADYVLQGSVQRAGNKVRISFTLLNGTSGEQLWAERFDRDLRDVFAIQDELGQRIITLLIGSVESDAMRRSLHKPLQDLSAYDYYLKGNQCFVEWHGSREDLDQAERMYKEAVALDPGFSSAYAGLAAVEARRLECGWTTRPDETGNAAVGHARRAVELDNKNSRARLLLAWCYFTVRSDFESAEAQLRIALELNPNDYHNYCLGGWICMCAGKLEEGIRCSKEAIKRNPLLPDDCLWTIGYTEYLYGNYTRALDAFGRILHRDAEIEAGAAACYAQLGLFDRAADAAEAFHRSCHNRPLRDAAYWRTHFAESVLFKFKDESAVDHLIDGLRKAGLVD